MGVPTQSSKGLRVSTRCRDLEQFVRAYHRYCEDSGVFISHARRSVGEVVAFSFDLADGSAALAGLGAVIEQLPNADNRFGRAGVVIALHRLSRSTRRVFNDLTAARMSAQERSDQTPPPIAEARAFTSNIQMIDPEALTPIPQPPPTKPIAAPSPADEPVRYSRTATRSIAAIAIRPPAIRTPPAGHVAAAPSVVVEAQPEAVVEPSEAIAEQTARMSSPPIDDFAPRTPDAPLLEGPAPSGSGRYEAPPLAPAPLELLASRVAEGTNPPETSATSSDVVPALIATAEPMPALAATPVPLPIAAPMPAALVPHPLAAPMLATPVPQPPAPARWTKRRLWAVAVLAGASLLALGIVIGATFVAGRTRGATPSTPIATAPSPAAATPAPVATAPAAPAPAAPAPPVATPPAIPVAAAPPQPAPVAAVAKPPVHVATKRPSHPKKPPAHPVKHTHSAPAHCASLNCL